MANPALPAPAGSSAAPALPAGAATAPESISSADLFGDAMASPTGTAPGPLQPNVTPGFVGQNGQWGHSLIDTRAYGKLKTFSGKEEDWATWSFVARSYLDLLSIGFRELLIDAEAAALATDVRLIDMSPMARSHAWTLFSVLTQSVEGRALSVIMGSESSNGLQAWRLLVDAYEPRVGGRYTAMLMGVIGPQWLHLKESQFLETLETWELQVRRYEEQSKEKVTSATKCAVVMRNAPGGIRTALRTSSSIIGSDYELLKKAIKDYLQTGVEFDGRGLAAEAAAKAGGGADPHGPAPMDVGALSWKGGKKGKEGKGKDSQKGKYGKDKGKSWKGKQGKHWGSGSKQFQGNCSYCGKWGHKKAECRIRERDKKGKGSSTNAVDKEGEKSTNAVSYTNLDSAASSSARPETKLTHSVRSVPKRKDPSSPHEERSPSAVRSPSESRAKWADTYDDEIPDIGSEDSWVSAITREGWIGAIAKRGDQFIMYDSGSDEHVCTQDFGGWGAERESSVRLNAVSGDALDIIGEKRILLTLAGKAGPVTIETIFQVSKNARKNILSTGKMFKQGFKAVIDPSRSSYLTHDESEDYMPLYMNGNSFWSLSIR